MDARHPIPPERLHRRCGVLVKIGNALHQAGRARRAVQAYRRALQINPSVPEAWNNLGNALGDIGQLNESIEAYRAALRLNPSLDRTYSNLGVALREKDQLAEAVAALETAVALNPSSSVAWDNLGIALREHGQGDRAAAAHERAIALDPDSPAAYSNLSIAYRAMGRLTEAAQAARTAIALSPHYAEAHNNLGVALADQGLADEAIGAYRAALRLKPDYSDACTNVGASLADKGEFAPALALCRKAVQIDPSNAHAHFNLAVILLLTGDFSAGWEEYEWRWKCKGLLPPCRFAEPRWDGGDLNGRTLLLHAEQGLGDAIQFVRYIPLIAGRGGRVALECPPELHRLFRGLAGAARVIATGDQRPPFDVHCPIASLPGLFGTTLETIPADTPYLTADPAISERWRARLGPRAADRPLRVGLAWAGKPAHANDRHRSLRLPQLAPLANARATFYSLQKGPAADQVAELPPGFPLIDWSADLTDLADTAGLIASLDLVISVDTSVAHLAGALGKPTWTLIPFNPDWRWLLSRPDTPWYPTMRLFRQIERGNWDEVIGRLAAALGQVSRRV